MIDTVLTITVGRPIAAKQRVENAGPRDPVLIQD